MTTKDRQTVDRRNVSRQTVPKSWPRQRKHPCIDSRATNWQEELMMTWCRTQWVRLWTLDSRVNGLKGSLGLCRVELGGSGPPIWIRYVLGCAVNECSNIILKYDAYCRVQIGLKVNLTFKLSFRLMCHNIRRYSTISIGKWKDHINNDHQKRILDLLTITQYIESLNQFIVIPTLRSYVKRIHFSMIWTQFCQYFLFYWCAMTIPARQKVDTIALQQLVTIGYIFHYLKHADFNIK